MGIDRRRIPNPFDKTIVRDLWTDPPDVPTINADVSEGILGELTRVLETGESVGVAVQGEAGTGKTHLLSRLRRSPLVARSACVVHVPPLVGHPDEFVRHLLYHLVVSLQRTPDGAAMPPIREIFVSFVTTRVMKRHGRIRVNRQELREIRRRARPILREAAPTADPDVLRALEAVIRGQEELACDWLRGQALDAEELREIGIERNVTGEDQALRIVVALSALARLAEPPRALVYTFDQIDGYVESERRRRFAEVAAELVHRPNGLVLTMCLPGTWQDLEADAPMPIVQRLSRGGMPPLQMRGLSPAEIRQILELRLGPVFADEERPNALYPFRDRDLVAITSLAPGRVPARRVLTEARARFEQWRTGEEPETKASVDPAARAEALLRALRRRLEEPAGDVPPPDELQTRALARFSLETCISVEDPPEPLDETLDLVVEEGRRVGLAFVDASDARSIWRRLERVLDLAGDEVDHVVVVRDERARLSKAAPKTERLLARVDAHASSTLYRLPPAVLGQLRTARTLVDEAASGDLTYECGGSRVAATREEVLGAYRRSGLLRENALVAAVLGASGQSPAGATS
jgi:hypothetical protein